MNQRSLLEIFRWILKHRSTSLEPLKDSIRVSGLGFRVEVLGAPGSVERWGCQSMGSA